MTDREYIDEVEAVLGNAADLRHHVPDKPTLISEFGLANAEWQPTKEMRASFEVLDFHNALWASALSGVSGTAMFWWWERLDQRNHYSHYRPLAGFVADIPWTTARLRPANIHTLDPRVRMHGLAGRDRAYAWIFDPISSFENVVVRGKRPVLLSDVQLDVEGLANKTYCVEWWDTRVGGLLKQGRVEPTDGRLRLCVPPFTHDIAAKVFPYARPLP